MDSLTAGLARSSLKPGSRVTVTGAAGLIGARFINVLLVECAVEVTGIDALPVSDWWRLEAAIGNPNFLAVQADLADDARLRELVDGSDLVVHMAASTTMQQGAKDPSADLWNGLDATRRVLEAMRQSGTRRLLYPSSSAVYGSLASERSASEADGPLLPCSTYGAAKLACEGLVSAYSNLFDLDSIIVRYGTVIGPDMDRGVIPSLLAQVPSGHVSVLGNGHQERSFVLVQDAVAASLMLASALPDGCEVFNVASEGTTSVRQIVDIVQQESTTPFEVSYGSGTQGWRGDVPVVALDISRLRAQGWRSPQHSDDAVRDCVRGLQTHGVRLRGDEPNATSVASLRKGRP